MKQEKSNFTRKLSYMEQKQIDYIIGHRGSNGNEMHIVFLYGPKLLRWAMWPMVLLLHVFVEGKILLKTFSQDQEAYFECMYMLSDIV
jgi:hypothetical protein